MPITSLHKDSLVRQEPQSPGLSMPLKHCSHFELPHDTEPLISIHQLATSRLSLTPAPRGRRVKIRNFKIFNKLPLELQQIIWEECAMIPGCIQFDVYGRPGWDLPGWCLIDWKLFVRGGGSQCSPLTMCLSCWPAALLYIE